MLVSFITILMKRSLLALALLVNAAPLFANDEGGTPGYIPDYRELVREGYGPHAEAREDLYRLTLNQRAAPKPTQAYYGKGFTVYYGFTAVPVYANLANTLYAFGYPLDFFRNLLPTSLTDTDLSRARVVVANQSGSYGPGDFETQARAAHGNAVTTVQKVTPANLSAIGEKPSH